MLTHPTQVLWLLLGLHCKLVNLALSSVETYNVWMSAITSTTNNILVKLSLEHLKT